MGQHQEAANMAVPLAQRAWRTAAASVAHPSRDDPGANMSARPVPTALGEGLLQRVVVQLRHLRRGVRSWRQGPGRPQALGGGAQATILCALGGAEVPPRQFLRRRLPVLCFVRARGAGARRIRTSLLVSKGGAKRAL